MSGKYQQHPMEQKFHMDREARQKEEARIKECYASFLEQNEYHDTPDVARAFLGGYAQGKYDAKADMPKKEGEQ